MNIKFEKNEIAGKQIFMEHVVIKDNKSSNLISKEELGWKQLDEYVNIMKQECRENSNEYYFCKMISEDVKRKNADGIKEHISKKKDVLNNILTNTTSSVLASGFWELLKSLHIIV